MSSSVPVEEIGTTNFLQVYPGNNIINPDSRAQIGTNVSQTQLKLENNLNTAFPNTVQFNTTGINHASFGTSQTQTYDAMINAGEIAGSDLGTLTLSQSTNLGNITATLGPIGAGNYSLTIDGNKVSRGRIDITLPALQPGTPPVQLFVASNVPINADYDIYIRSATTAFLPGWNGSLGGGFNTGIPGPPFVYTGTENDLTLAAGDECVVNVKCWGTDKYNVRFYRIKI
tara:strand:+ start:810 stop:1496 length:687 start_codon:yes stop_codon:yes gene_type:complete